MVAGANNRIRVGIIGTGGRGRYIIKELKKLDGIEFGAVCDVYDARRAEAAAVAGVPVEQYADYRQVLDRKDVDAVVVAAPDHWHGAMTVAALNAGKDVYVEKPMVHYPKDAQAIVRAVRRHKRVLQVGTQGRLLPHNLDAKKMVDAGALGTVGLVRTWYNGNRGYILTPPPGFEQKPAGLDWDGWLGPGPKVPWNPDIYFSPYKWMHYDGGMIMGIGIHVVDDAHTLLGLNTHPRAAMASGGVYYYKDGRDSPDVVNFLLDYGRLTLTFEAECLTCPGVRETGGVMLRGTGGVLRTERYIARPDDTAWEYTPNPSFSKSGAAKGTGTPQSAERLLRNWVECMRSRAKTVANEEVAYWSTIACFMANEALKTRSRVAWQADWGLPA
jgi:predicted dehydrogenase